ncbi:MAG: hypothetical protein ONB44_17295 [candidate division KSB1 bacterium]|nr:hypothetical protein [candidate division KSB1 bacterium]MDZ7303892.1 hypothetical protein [candidate division KSB1 bacterium]MDZ7313184.1 hypothetical protein [candidate division KSB1 bacterium]
MQKKKFTYIFPLVLALGLLAASPQFKTFLTQDDLEKGKALGISIDALGQMRLAPEVRERFRATMPYLWCVATDPQENIYVGGGNPAVVLRAGVKATPDTVFTSTEVAVFALTFVQNSLYIATSPDGQIYKQTGNTKAQPFFKPEAKYIWSLVPRPDGALYVATGEPGRIYLVQSSGKSEIFFESEEKHIRSLAFDKTSGHLFAGSSGNGYVYRFGPSGAVSVLFDAPFPEIHQLAVSPEGMVYAAAAGEAAVRPGILPTPIGTVVSEASDTAEEEETPIMITATLEDQQQAPSAVPAQVSATKGLGAVYRINQEGITKTLWNLRQDRVHSLLLEASGSLLVGTGDRGRVYRLGDDGVRTLLAQLEAGQITAMIAVRNERVILTTANTGTVQILNPQIREKGEYLSEVIDAGVPSQWGAINWLQSGDGQVRFFTRSGNTGKPDKTWSAWAAVQGPASGGTINSPLARFLQWKLEMAGNGKSSAMVKRIQVSYLQKNVAPEVTSITIYTPGEAFPQAKEQAANHLSESQDGGSPSPRSIQPPDAGRKTFQKGAQSIGWQTRDENNDRLIYKIEICAVGENVWRELEKDYAGTVYTWDSQALPDGEYQVRITASDRRSNPPGLALEAEKVSEIFVIDNTPPEVKNLAVQKNGTQWIASFEASDQLSRIKEAWYAVDAGDWQLIYPTDSVADQRREIYQFKMTSLGTGSAAPGVLAVKVVDANGNSGFGKIRMK